MENEYIERCPETCAEYKIDRESILEEFMYFSFYDSTQQTGWSGVFDTLLPAAPQGAKSSFTLGTWNARSLFCRDSVAFNKKLKMLENKSNN